MTNKQFATVSSICGLVGVILLVTSFIINPGPPPGSTLPELQAFGEKHHIAIIFGAWLQAVSPPMIIIFALAVVHLGGAGVRFAGQITLLGGVILCMVSLTEVIFYLNAASSKPLLGFE